MEHSSCYNQPVYWPGDPLGSPLGFIPHRYLPTGIRLSGSMLILTMPQRSKQHDTSTLTDMSELKKYGKQAKSVHIDWAGPAVFVSQEHFYGTARTMKKLIHGLNSHLPNLQMVSVTVLMRGADCNPLTTRRIALLGALHGLKVPWSINYLVDAKLPSKEEKVSEALIKEKLHTSWKQSFMSTLKVGKFPAFHNPYPTKANVDSHSSADSSEFIDDSVVFNLLPRKVNHLTRFRSSRGKWPQFGDAQAVDLNSSRDSSPEFIYSQPYPCPTKATVDYHSSTRSWPAWPQFGDAQTVNFDSSTDSSPEFSCAQPKPVKFHSSTGRSHKFSYAAYPTNSSPGFSNAPASYDLFSTSVSNDFVSSTGSWSKLSDVELW